MVKKDITIKLKKGLEARPVAIIVQTASKYACDIKFISGEKKVNAKSIMGMMSLGLAQGQDVTVIAEGADENEAMKDIEGYLSSGQ